MKWTLGFNGVYGVGKAHSPSIGGIIMENTIKEKKMESTILSGGLGV